MKQHYNPEFYLKQWAAPDDRMLCVMRLVNGKVVLGRKFPAGSGYGIDIYRTDGVPEENAHHLETEFISPLDNAACRAMQRILARDPSPWDGEERKAWTTFILSLLYRNPDAVVLIRNLMRDLWSEGTKALENDYEARRRPDDPLTFAEFFAKTNPAAPEIATTNFIMQTIENERVGPTIFDMHWTAVYVPKSKHTFLTSDRPIVMPMGLANPKAYIALAVGPQALFVASKQKGFGEFLATSYPNSGLVKEINRAIVAQARQFVWSTDDAQLPFVRKHMATAGERPLLTEAAKQEGLAAARGLPWFAQGRNPQ